MIQKGDYIRKKNFEPIGKKIGVIVNSVFQTSNKNVISINGFCLLDLNHIEIITKDEADKLNSKFNQIEIVASSKPDINTSCFREDNGEPKRKINNEFTAKVLAFKHQMKNPSGNFQAYKCSHCGAFHVGKTLEQV